MSLLKKLFGDSDKINQRYAEIRIANEKKGFEQAKERGISVPTEPFRIVKMVPLPESEDGEDYWGVADFILAEYPVEMGLLVASAFGNMTLELGFDPYGRIMIGMQYVDRKAGAFSITRFSFAKEHPDFYKYVTEPDCPGRTQKALDILTAAMFQFSSADHAKDAFPKAMVVPEMKTGVKERMHSIDEAVAKYVVR